MDNVEDNIYHISRLLQPEDITRLVNEIYNPVSSGSEPCSEAVSFYSAIYLDTFGDYQDMTGLRNINVNQEGMSYSIELECSKFYSNRNLINYMEGKGKSHRYVAGFISISDEAFVMEFKRQEVSITVEPGDIVFCPSYFTYRHTIKSDIERGFEVITFYSVINYKTVL